MEMRWGIREATSVNTNKICMQVQAHPHCSAMARSGVHSVSNDDEDDDDDFMY